MKIIKTVSEMRTIRRALQGSIGFIPTMGYLHTGHISLVEKARKQTDHVIVSIFVNPKQFNRHTDFLSYPQNIKRDRAMLKKANVDYVFLPHGDELYPSDYSTYVNVEEITDKLEGKSRPGHFRGVTTIVTKLFNIIQPTHTYFGQKDAQQVLVVKKMITDLNMPIKFIIGKIVRESDGLAMSSRNVLLSKKERMEVPVLFQSLQLSKELFDKGERDVKKIKLTMKKCIEKTSGNIEYISVADTDTLEELEKIEGKALVSMAVFFGKTRLIDNIIL